MHKYKVFRREDISEARKLIGTKGWFCEHEEALDKRDFVHFEPQNLDSIDEDEEDCYQWKADGDNIKVGYKFFVVEI